MFVKSKSRGAFLVGVGRNKMPGLCLRGPENDVWGLQEVLKNNYRQSVSVCLNEQAKKDEILRGLETLAPYEIRAFYYSGHGSRIAMLSTDDTDYTEILIPYDHDWGNPLIDDEIYGVLSRFGYGRTYCIFDCCHAQGMSRDLSICRGVEAPAGMSLPLRSRAIKGTNIIEISACQNHEPSYEKEIEGKWRGVFSWAMTKVLTERPLISLCDFQRKIEKEIALYSPQKPTISMDSFDIIFS